MRVDALDAATALAGIVEGAVDEVLDGVVEVCVGADVSRVLAAELQAERRERSRGGALHRLAPFDRSGEAYMVDRFRSDQAMGCLMIEGQRREEVSRQTGLVHRRLKAFADQQCLGGVL